MYVLLFYCFSSKKNVAHARLIDESVKQIGGVKQNMKGSLQKKTNVTVGIFKTDKFQRTIKKTDEYG